MSAELFDLAAYRIKKRLAALAKDPVQSYNSEWLRMTFQTTGITRKKYPQVMQIPKVVLKYTNEDKP